MAARNLVNLKDVSKQYASRPILTGVTLGVGAGDRIGIVGRNGDGKSTLLRLIEGSETPDSGRVTRERATTIGLVGQSDELDDGDSIQDALVGDRPDHEWMASARIRSVLDGLLGGVEMPRFAGGRYTPIGTLSGGERRRIALAKVLIDDPELLLLDEPTNHLDVEGVDWLAHFLNERKGSLLVVTHDRWFLDAVVQNTWEVVNETVHQYEGGYAAYVLARAERDRQESASEQRRRALIRKELAWLRRGPPARTTKPKFRVDAANELIADEPPARNQVELLRFATKRLGNRVIDAIGISYAHEPDQKPLLNDITWRFGPADRVALVGVNGAGKTTLMKLLANELEPTKGSVKRGLTVHVAQLTQNTVEMNEELSVLESLEEARLVATTSEGVEITASMLCERFGFRGARGRTLVKDLSGGERRRLQLMCLLMEEPNVLLLDEPTNDLDIETLNALEDLLDSWPGTLVVISHDRYFVERVTDNVYGLMGDGGLRHLPRGIDQYIEERRAAAAANAEDNGAWAKPASNEKPKGEIQREARKALPKLEKRIAKLERRKEELNAQMEEHASDHVKLAEIQQELDATAEELAQAESDWLEVSEVVESG